LSVVGASKSGPVDLFGIGEQWAAVDVELGRDFAIGNVVSVECPLVRDIVGVGH